MTVALNLESVLPTVRRVHTAATIDDAEDAIQTALAEGLEKGWDLTPRNVIACARFRLLSAMQRRDANNLSLDALAEDTDARAPVELAVVEDDLDSTLALLDAEVDTFTREAIENVRRFDDRCTRPRGENNNKARYPDHVVEEARRLHREGLSHRKIAKRLGVRSMNAVGSWCRRETRLGTTSGWTEEKMLDALRALAARLGRQPTVRELQTDHATPGSTLYETHFGSWSNALIAAGFPGRSQGKRLTPGRPGMAR